MEVFFYMKRILLKANQGRVYLFQHPTKSIEILSGLLSVFFGLVFFINGKSLIKNEFYRSFDYVGPMWIWWLVILLGTTQLNASRKDTLESNILSAITLKVNSLVTFIIALMFAADYPPLGTGFFTYSILSGFYLLAGIELSVQNTYELLIRTENRKT